MAGYEGSGSPTPSEQEDNDDKNEDNFTEHKEEAQEDDDTQADETVNDGEPNESSPQDNNNNYMNPGNEADGAQGLPESEDTEMAQPAHVESDSDIMAHDPDAGLNLEEELGGMIVEVLDYDNGQIELLVMSIDSTPATPEL